MDHGQTIYLSDPTKKQGREGKGSLNSNHETKDSSPKDSARTHEHTSRPDTTMNAKRGRTSEIHETQSTRNLNLNQAKQKQIMQSSGHSLGGISLLIHNIDMQGDRVQLAECEPDRAEYEENTMTRPRKEGGMKGREGRGKYQWCTSIPRCSEDSRSFR